MRRVLVLASLAVLVLPAAADAISTDRPDFVESSEVVGRGRVQIETGLSFERHDGQRTRSTPLLLRVGVTDGLELRLKPMARCAARTRGSPTRASPMSRRG